MMSRKTLNENHQERKRKCPLLSNPSPECFCLKMDSQNVGNMLEYCAGEWEKCGVYLNEEKRKVKY